MLAALPTDSGGYWELVYTCWDFQIFILGTRHLTGTKEQYQGKQENVS